MEIHDPQSLFVSQLSSGCARDRIVTSALNIDLEKTFSFLPFTFALSLLHEVFLNVYPLLLEYLAWIPRLNTSLEYLAWIPRLNIWSHWTMPSSVSVTSMMQCYWWFPQGWCNLMLTYYKYFSPPYPSKRIVSLLVTTWSSLWMLSLALFCWSGMCLQRRYW